MLTLQHGIQLELHSSREGNDSYRSGWLEWSYSAFTGEQISEDSLWWKPFMCCTQMQISKNSHGKEKAESSSSSVWLKDSVLVWTPLPWHNRRTGQHSYKCEIFISEKNWLVVKWQKNLYKAEQQMASSFYIVSSKCHKKVFVWDWWKKKDKNNEHILRWTVVW